MNPEQEAYFKKMRAMSAKEILDNIKAEFADNPEPIEMLEYDYDYVLSLDEEEAWRYAVQLDGYLSMWWR